VSSNGIGIEVQYLVVQSGEIDKGAARSAIDRRVSGDARGNCSGSAEVADAFIVSGTVEMRESPCPFVVEKTKQVIAQ
jgi:hypothetical protein